MTERLDPTAARLQDMEPADFVVLDLEGLLNRCMGNIDLVQRLLAKFQQRLPEDLTELETMIEQGNPRQIAGVAHRIKGTSVSMSAQGLANAAAEIEELGRVGRMADIPAGVEHLRCEWERYLRYAAELPPPNSNQENTPASR
jgi:HPt (histidine-containing phosphotransfer) domain-containing protein